MTPSKKDRKNYQQKITMVAGAEGASPYGKYTTVQEEGKSLFCDATTEE